jgi:2-C-methyl-D-erythritol 4-phosphate cytidylyltransferase/2-C-methyl-D-erythritol 2,4-cyclodiphosphate synthase
MVTTGAVIVSAGVGKRMNAAVSKQYLSVGGKPIVVHALEAFERSKAVDAIVLVVGAGDEAFGETLLETYGLRKVVAVVAGGAERQHSVRRGVEALASHHPEAAWVLVHDGARPLVTSEVIDRALAAAAETGASVPGVPVKDTIKEADRDGIVVATPARSSLWAIQTPQAFRVDLLLEAHRTAEAEGFLGTDDAMLAERIGVLVRVAEGDYRNVKVTTPDDLGLVERLLAERDVAADRDTTAVMDKGDVSGIRAAVRTAVPSEGEGTMIRVGQGFDVHAFAEGRKCIIGGVDIPFEKGLLGHSDADVLLHAVADAVLGALGLGDIGKHFPDTDPAFKGADSMKLLEQVWGLARERGYALGNADCTVIAQRPKLAPHIEAMAGNIARALGAEPSQVNVKATTSEKLGFTGREEGIAAQAVVCLVNAAANT